MLDDTEADMRDILTEKIGRQLTVDLDSLHLIDITASLERIVSTIVSATDDASASVYALAVQQLRTRVPVYEQFGHFVQYHLVQRVAGLRASGKLLSVLLALFSGLAQKV